MTKLVKDTEVEFKATCNFAGKPKKEGDKVTVTKAQAANLKKRDLIK